MVAVTPGPVGSVLHPPLQAMSVVVPAHNEQDALPACLLALAAALAAVAHERPKLQLALCLVLDSCTDGSHAIAEAFAASGSSGSTEVFVLPVNERRVGTARACGFTLVQREAELARISPAAHWIASTDADTIVPTTWLVEQLTRAERGADVVVGTVEPDARLHPDQRAAWLVRHQLTDGHPHVHGANLGLRASAYQAVGGFAALDQHEDVDLVARLRRDDRFVLDATDATRVVTSSRTVSRVTDGFAGYLSDLQGA